MDKCHADGICYAPEAAYSGDGSALCILSFDLGDWFYSGVKSFTTLPK